MCWGGGHRSAVWWVNGILLYYNDERDISCNKLGSELLKGKSVQLQYGISIVVCNSERYKNVKGVEEEKPRLCAPPKTYWMADVGIVYLKTKVISQEAIIAGYYSS